MAQVKRLLRHATVELAAGKRKCHRDKKHSIREGERFLHVRTGTFERKNYCATCARPMLEVAGKDLVVLGDVLDGRAPMPINSGDDGGEP